MDADASVPTDAKPTAPAQSTHTDEPPATAYGRPIADYALLSDCHGAGLVSRDGVVEWLCIPRFDSAPVFARTLDVLGGYWSLGPVGGAQRTSRRYLTDSLVLETLHETPDGTVRVTDALAVGPNNSGHELGQDAPHLLARRVQGVEGRVEMFTGFAPRPEFGLVRPMLSELEGGVRSRGTADCYALSSPIPLSLADEATVAQGRFTVGAGESVTFGLAWGQSGINEPRIWEQARLESLLDDTHAAWESWAGEHQAYDGPWADLVDFGGRVLQGLTYFPTGAIVAAATSSLPEVVGGERNWDYRYAWIRDASLTLEALWVAACPDEAIKFFTWLLEAAAARNQGQAHVQIVFGVTGRHDLSERTVPHLQGWRGSRPVRSGNGAWQQTQLDVYGELLSAAHRLKSQLADLDVDQKQRLIDLADQAADRWSDKDQGIWEVRSEPRHFLHSKLMCWVALDRALDMTEWLGAEDHADRWRREREAVRASVLEHGWNPDVGAFTQSYGSDVVDAAALMLPITGCLNPQDDKVLSTIEVIQRELSDERGLIRRYDGPDGLAGEEGTFLLCTFWLIEALALAGQIDAAEDLMETAVGCANDLGLMAEEVDIQTGEQLGNFPQAFSHVGLINAAWAIHQARQRREAGPGGEGNDADGQ